MRTLQYLGLSALLIGYLGLFLSPTVAVAQLPNAAQLKNLTKEQRKKLLQEKRKMELAAAAKAKADARTKAKAKAEAQAKAKARAKAEELEVARPAVVKKPVQPTERKPIPAEATAPALAKLIDEWIDRQLEAAQVPASPLSSDAEFLRRVSLDLTGVIPSGERAKAFLESTDPDKRAKYVDELLANENYGRKLADYWQARFFPRESDNRFVLREPFVKWLKDEFNHNTPWDQFATNIVTGSGTVEENPGVTFFLANRTLDKITDNVTENFLGVQLECAQCHNHPFVSWKQSEYWGMAAFFSKVMPDRPKNGNKGEDNSKIGVQERVRANSTRSFLPEAAMKVPPKFLEGAEAKLESREPYRPAFAEWMTSPSNPYFSKATVNRAWFFLFGEGFVNPVDDMHPANKPSHPELLAELSQRFAASGFDYKNLMKGICLSRAYQRTSKPTEGNEENEELLFAHQTVRVMTPEQLYDSLAAVTGTVQNDDPRRKRANTRRNAPNARDQFVQFFLAGSEELSRVEYEAGIPQALKLMNSRSSGNTAIAKAITGNGSKEVALEKLYLATLSRKPTAEEKARLVKYLDTATSPAEGYADVLWALLNSSEFTTVR